MYRLSGRIAAGNLYYSEYVGWFEDGSPLVKTRHLKYAFPKIMDCGFLARVRTRRQPEVRGNGKPPGTNWGSAVDRRFESKWSIGPSSQPKKSIASSQ
jgi:hypothetical protein